MPEEWGTSWEIGWDYLHICSNMDSRWVFFIDSDTTLGDSNRYPHEKHVLYHSLPQDPVSMYDKI